MIVSILNQKGGVGKTTLSINLARAVHLNKWGRHVLIDSDPQGTSQIWQAQSEEQKLKVIHYPKPNLHKEIKPLTYQHDWLFIDGAPAINELATSAIQCSDIILIPVQPSPPDIWSTENMAKLVSDRISWSKGKVKAAFIVQRQIINSIVSREVNAVLNSFWVSHGISVFESRTSQRLVYSTSIGKGSTVLDEPKNEASKEILSIAYELKALVG
jgi:chromosome partitioning protein